MKRIDKYKHKLEHACEASQNEEQVSLAFQELINLLATYDEKKELSDHYEKLTEGLQTAAK